MTNSVHFDPAAGGDGTTITDDSNPSTGLGNYGWKTRFVPALANIVNIGKTAVQKAIEAYAGAALSQSWAEQSQAARNAAISLWGSNTAQTETLAPISQTLHLGTVVASFLYDTSKDSDGGAWRKRCADKSWYTETICTGVWRGQQTEASCRAISGAATGDYFQSTADGQFYSLNAGSGVTQVYRGNKREFPAQALIIAEAGRVVMYDATAPGCPMWRVSSGADGTDGVLGWGSSSAASLTGVFAVNGKVCIVGAVATGLAVYDFAKDDIRLGHSAAYVLTNRSIANDRATTSYASGGDGYVLASHAVNAIAMTVLPTAPIDPATGLPVPTIAVATNGGVSVIKDDGTVVNWLTAQGYICSVSIDKNGRLFASGGDGVAWRSWMLDRIPESSTNTYDRIFHSGSTPARLGSDGDSGQVLRSANFGQYRAFAVLGFGIHLLKENPATPSKGMVNYLNHLYTSGWQVGDIRRAWLADTVAGTVVGGASEPDRSVKNQAITVVGTLTKSAVASGAQLVAYSGFSSSNYLQQAYSADLDFGTGDFCVMGWAYPQTSNVTMFCRCTPLTDTSLLAIYSNTSLDVYIAGSAAISAPALTMGVWTHVCFVRLSGVAYLYVNGLLVGQAANTANLSSSTATTCLGVYHYSGAITSPFVGSLSLWRFGATAPSADQISHIYRTEKELFNPGAQCTLAATSSNVTTLAYDDDTDTWHAGTTEARSSFKGLLRVDSEVVAVTSLSASGGAILAARAPGATYYQPAVLLRDEIKRKAEARKALGKEPVFYEFDAVSGQTVFTLQQGYTVKAVYVAGTLKRIGSTKDYTVNTDGYRETVTFGTAPGSAAWVSIMAVKA